ncbi:CDP-glycerol glycerophosphotransferase family protein [Virgibacillus halophilus]|uniref:CDP-glycerol glycerophosphotransferase family protein n=1 Tax=Tigheibacillus halophilus TaxID=361280 RepID=A0ABU5C4K7_9BACI|nr:CDP-glycerol glycerophosphotransferase family protein [Virgibacillus halophilus]
MFKEIIIFIYLILFRIVFNIFRLLPLQRGKTVFVASFEDNILYTLRDVEKQTDERMIVLRLSDWKVTIQETARIRVLEFAFPHIFHWFQAVYHLATSKIIFVDNYYGFLAAANVRKEVSVIQLWHAAGAIKLFGLRNPAISERPAIAKWRFRKVYQHFDHVVVGCEAMAGIFQESFGIDHEKMLRTGVPRTDFFFDQLALEREREKFLRQYPVIRDKQVILYAPTFRNGPKTTAELPLNINEMCQSLCEDYVLFLHLHPAVKVDISISNQTFVIDLSDYHNVNHLLAFTDILITDYSSIPFEFSLLERPMIFFAYDEEAYSVASGFWEPYEDMVPGPIVKNTTELVDALLQKDAFDMDAVRKFARKWNAYSRGRSSQALVERFYRS